MVDCVNIRAESWDIRGGFVISREVKNSADTVLVEIQKDGVIGRGECVPLKRYQHTQETVISEIEAIRGQILNLDKQILQKYLPAGPARNAVDCALWDWQAKAMGKTWAQLCDLPEIKPLKTAYTLSLDNPEKMAQNALQNNQFSLLKMKMNGSDADVERIKVIKAVAPHAQLILDANESWTLDHLDNLLPMLIDSDVVLIEQPLPEGNDDGLIDFKCPIPIAADESCHTVDSLADLVGKYQVVNIKLDKTGGLTHALQLKAEAIKRGFDVMVGCMASTSLGILPAMVVGQDVAFCDLDGAFLLENDPYRVVFYQNGQVFTA